jgi:hypothetical protein
MVPNALRTWFVIHFWADIAFALPLFVVPVPTLTLFGWEPQEVDPLTTRLVAAALFGIGIESLLGRNADASAFRAMLNLKCIWAAAATAGILWAQLDLTDHAPWGGWLFLGIFAAFLGVWSYWRGRLSQSA